MPDPKLEIRPAGAKGRGVFALAPIAQGQRVLALEGRVLPSDALTDDLLALQIGPDLWLCSDGSLLDDCVNHSCDPNTGFTTGETNLYALRDIPAGEEICWDYSTSISEAGWSLECCCGSPRCRGVVRSWSELRLEERERLAPIALKYLRTD
ncbi:MAG TPA: SET domain-containing protein-lysine N-methyltransferase [Gemmataceae bacterium]|nr:SET domain-containing protein-lysine N-methyltransferase [Gemmataceae bacterium]